MLVNRIGDIGLCLAICSIFLKFRCIDYATVFSLAPLATDTSISFLLFEFDEISVLTFLLFFGAVGKSAQIGLHLWLPDAMEGPTPVSALIHAATLVTAGIFLIIRCSILFENSSVSLTIVTIFGSITAFFAASVGLVQNDLKKVIAYSTCSQLGYMAFCCGLSHYSVALFHLANHALFKALLFLSAGCIIHAIHDEQDLRKMGALLRFLPVSYTMVLIGSMALTGFPFLTGFYSKDAILEIALVTPCFVGNFSH
jgi:NADH:ubiquinone oxidoreductase subunit 5 (subunit L)/multisubunit Na+/H+ antiporter MnhA subunit